MILRLYSRTYQLVKDNLILVQPVLLFLLLLSLLLTPISMGGFNIAILFVALAMYCAFGAGWFSMFHECVKLSAYPDLSEEEKSANTVSLLKEFFPGVGKYFHKFLLGILIYGFILFLAINIFGGIIGAKFIGFPESINSSELMSIYLNADKSTEILNKISAADKMKIGLWNGLGFIIMSICTYFMMFWPQAMISQDKNPILAHIESIKTVLKRPFTTLVIYISQWTSIIGISFLGAQNSKNFIAHLFILMLFVLVIVYFTMMTFLYFEKYRKNNSDSWTDSFR